MTRRSATVSVLAEPTEGEQWLRTLAGRQDLGYDEEGRSAEPAPERPAKPSRPPQGARDPGPPQPDGDAYVRAHGLAALRGVPYEGGAWDRA